MARAGDRRETGEHVADAADGDDAGAAGDLPPQAADVDVERAIERRRLAAPRGARQVVAQHLAAGVPDEVLEQVELDRGQVDAAALDAGLARGALEPHAAGFGDARPGAIDALASQHRAHPRHDFLGSSGPPT